MVSDGGARRVGSEARRERARTIGCRIRIALAVRDMRQTDLARAVRRQPGQIAAYIHGRGVPRPAMLDRLAAALGVTPAWLAGHAVEEPTVEAAIGVDRTDWWPRRRAAEAGGGDHDQ